VIRIATRGSALALAQSRLVAARLAAIGLPSELVVRRTQGDAIVDRPFRQMEGKGFFTKELEEALLAEEAELAVHSLKDLPTEMPAGLTIAATPEREDPSDVLVVRRERHDPRFALPVAPGSRVGTTSTRRRAQWIARRPDTTLVELRGNVPTRIEKLLRGEYDAIVIARAGIARLGADLSTLVAVRLDPRSFVPAPGQGALAIEIRDDARELARSLLVLDDREVRAAVDAERRVLALLGGGCLEPVGAFARRRGESVVVDAVKGPPEEGVGPLRRARVEAPSFAHAAALAAERLGDPGSEVPGGLRGRTVALTGQRGRFELLARELEERGARVLLAPLVETVRDPAPEATRALANALEFDELAFTSATAVEAFVALAPAPVLAELRAGAGPRIAAIGVATADALLDAGLPVRRVADGSGGEALAGAIVRDAGAKRGRALLPGAHDGMPQLGESLARAGFDVVRAPIYRTRSSDDGEVERVRGERFDAAVIASPSAVASFAKRRPFEAASFVAIGTTTLAALADAGLEPRIASRSPEPAAIADAVASRTHD